MSPQDQVAMRNAPPPPAGRTQGREGAGQARAWPAAVDGGWLSRESVGGVRVVGVSLSKVVKHSLGRARCSLILFLFLGASVAEAQKTDSVWIRNGDRIIGEVKSLSRGLLKYSTDDLGTISVEWDKVERISTTTVLEVQLSRDKKLYGHLGQAAAGIRRSAPSRSPWARSRGWSRSSSAS